MNRERVIFAAVMCGVAIAVCCLPPQVAKDVTHDGCVLIEDTTDASDGEKQFCATAEQLAPFVAGFFDKRRDAGASADASSAVMHVRIVALKDAGTDDGR